MDWECLPSNEYGFDWPQYGTYAFYEPLGAHKVAGQLIPTLGIHLVVETANGAWVNIIAICSSCIDLMPFEFVAHSLRRLAVLCA